MVLHNRIDYQMPILIYDNENSYVFYGFLFFLRTTENVYEIKGENKFNAIFSSASGNR